MSLPRVTLWQGLDDIYAAASNIFSIKIPYPVVGSFTSTWVTAPTSFPVAVPDKIFGLTLILDFIDRCHYDSLRARLRRVARCMAPAGAHRSAPFIRHRRRSHRSPSRIIGEPDTSVSSKGQKNFVFFCGFLCVLQVKGRFYTPHPRSLT